MTKINKFSNIYDKDGNLIRKVNEKTGTLDKYTLEEVEQLVDRNQQAAAQHDTRAQQNHQPIVKDKLPGRNDPCPCGSGKKFKNCHGKGIV